MTSWLEMRSSSVSISITSLSKRKPADHLILRVCQQAETQLNAESVFFMIQSFMSFYVAENIIVSAGFRPNTDQGSRFHLHQNRS